MAAVHPVHVLVLALAVIIVPFYKEARVISDFEKFITLTDNPQLIQITRQKSEELTK